jgi:hypothetical protein
MKHFRITKWIIQRIFLIRDRVVLGFCPNEFDVVIPRSGRERSLRLLRATQARFLD